MATSDSEAFESADEDFDFDIDPWESSSPEKTARDNREVLNSPKASDVLVTKEREKPEIPQLTEDTKKLGDSLKALEIGETFVRVKDDSKGSSAGDKSDSSDSDGGGDSVRTLKGDSKPRQDPLTAAPIENMLFETNNPSHDSSVPSEVDTSDVQTKASSKVDTDTDNIRSNSRSRKHEKKKPQTAREAKQKSSIKKLGTKITTKSVTPISESRTNSGSIACSTEYKESVHSDSLTNAREVEKLSESINTGADTVISTGMPSVKNEEKISSVLEKLTETSHGKEGGGWGGWGNWGVSSLLSTATESVSTLTSQVTHGFSSVLETGIGIPDPEELARLDAERERNSQNKDSSATQVSDEAERESVQSVAEEKLAESQSQDGAGLFGFSRVFSGVSSITKLVESTGSKVITGGLDTLETIGKKTMEVLQEGDPGLRKKREIFSEKIILSQVLREAKEKAEMEDKLNEDKEVMRKAHFETLFDDFQGLVHLEALEMLSKQCEIKVEAILKSLTGQVAVELQDKMTALKELCDIPDDDDADETEEQSTSNEWLKSLAESSHDLGVNVPTDKIANSWSDTIQWLSAYSPEIRPQEFHHKAISALARFTAVSVELFHKTAELLLVKEDRDPFQEAHCLQEMTLLLSVHISILAAKFSDTLTSHEEEENPGLTSVSDIITNIFLEASNSSSYIKEAFQLIIPVLQLGVKP